MIGKLSRRISWLVQTRKDDADAEQRERCRFAELQMTVAPQFMHEECLSRPSDFALSLSKMPFLRRSVTF